MIDKPTVGEVVQTAEGEGKVLRVSEMNGYAHVQVEGQQFEVMFENIERAAPPPSSKVFDEAMETNMFFDEATIQKEAAQIDSPKFPNRWGAGGTEPTTETTDQNGNPIPDPPYNLDDEQTKQLAAAVEEAEKAVGRARSEKSRKQREKALEKAERALESHIKAKQTAEDTPTPTAEPQPGDGEQEQPEQPEPKKKADEKKTTRKQPKSPLEDAFAGVLSGLDERVNERIDDKVDGELEQLREEVKKHQKLEVKVGDKTNMVEGLRHKQLNDLVTYASLRLSVLMVGMAGTGKTHAGAQAAEALGLAFYTMSVGAQTSKTDIIGYMTAGGDYVRTLFREAYENGGVFLMDEVDAGNANVLIQINAALSNELSAFPDKMVTRHPDFVFIASANTYGNGANRQYVGRNQLDAATLDRFTIIDWLIDDNLEKGLAIGRHRTAWYMAVRAARDYIADHSIRALVTPRATQKGSKMLEAGVHIEQVIPAVLLGSVPQDKQPDVTKVALKVFNHRDPDDTSNKVSMGV